MFKRSKISDKKENNIFKFFAFLLTPARRDALASEAEKDQKQKVAKLNWKLNYPKACWDLLQSTNVI